MYCYNCQSEIVLQTRPKRNETCPQCTVYVHCCMNCTFYDPNAHNDCREPQAEWVKDKEMANYCDFFEAKIGKNPSTASRQDEARKKLNDLFKTKKS